MTEYAFTSGAMKDDALFIVCNETSSNRLKKTYDQKKEQSWKRLCEHVAFELQ